MSGHPGDTDNTEIVGQEKGERGLSFFLKGKQYNLGVIFGVINK